MEREAIIQRYEKLIKRLKEIDSIFLLDIQNKFELLKQGYTYNIVDVTEECIKAGGMLLCGGQINGKTLPLAYSNRYQKQISKIK